MSQKTKIAGWIAVGALAGALTTVSLQTVARGTLAPLPLEELQQLAAVFGMIKSDYVEPVDEKKLITDAISGMVSSLDPHSQYFDKKSFKEFREGTTGKFVGVGIEITQEDGLIRVVSPIEGSPADRAGLKPGDLITRVDDTAVKGLTLNEAVKRMRGEPGTKVQLTIMRRDENRTFPVTITREEIRTQSVKGKVVEPGYAWLRLSQFQERTVDDFVAKLEDIYKREPNLKGLVLDLRNDPGGLLDAAVAVSAAFLPEGVTVVSLMPVSGPRGRTVCTEPLPKVWLPMMVARLWSCSAPATISLAEAEPSLTSTTSGTFLSAAGRLRSGSLPRRA